MEALPCSFERFTSTNLFILCRTEMRTRFFRFHVVSETCTNRWKASFSIRNPFFSNSDRNETKNGVPDRETIPLLILRMKRGLVYFFHPIFCFEKRSLPRRDRIRFRSVNEPPFHIGVLSCLISLWFRFRIGSRPGDARNETSLELPRVEARDTRRFQDASRRRKKIHKKGTHAGRKRCVRGGVPGGLREKASRLKAGTRHG